MLQNIHTHYIQPIRTFNRDARLFLRMTVINGIIFSGWQLFFNIYMLQSGVTREFLGIVNSLPSLMGLLFGIPIGRLSDRIGRRRAIIIGLTLSSFSFLGQVTFKQPALILIMSALTGVFNMFLIVSISPLMMKLSNLTNRTLLFSLNYGLQTLAGAVGSLFAGQLPALFGSLLHVGPTNAVAYQAVLITTVLLGTTALIPIWMMKEPQTHQTQPEAGSVATSPKSVLTRLTVKLATPNFLIGVGAAILIPYMNVFFKDRYQISDSLLGLLFSLSSLFIGIGSLIGPRLTTQLGGKIRTVAFTQLASVIFMLLIGFVPSLWVAGFSLLMRAALMNMSAPLYSAFCMEQTPERQQGFVSSVMNVAWQIGWSVGPYLSGLVQVRYGFTPLFITTTVLYLLAVGMMWRFFRDTEIMPVPVAVV
ncbi:MAG: MFS transporter [Chloroflexota bacterium]